MYEKEMKFGNKALDVMQEKINAYLEITGKNYTVDGRCFNAGCKAGVIIEFTTFSNNRQEQARECMYVGTSYYTLYKSLKSAYEDFSKWQTKQYMQDKEGFEEYKDLLPGKKDCLDMVVDKMMEEFITITLPTMETQFSLEQDMDDILDFDDEIEDDLPF